MSGTYDNIFGYAERNKLQSRFPLHLPREQYITRGAGFAEWRACRRGILEHSHNRVPKWRNPGLLGRCPGASQPNASRFRIARVWSATTPEKTSLVRLYARGKFAAEPYPFALALRPIREALAKLDPKPTPTPLPPRKPYVPSLVLQRKSKRRR